MVISIRTALLRRRPGGRAAGAVTLDPPFARAMGLPPPPGGCRTKRTFPRARRLARCVRCRAFRRS